MDWSGCPFVVSNPGTISGAVALRDDPRVSPEAIIVNMDDDLTAQEVAEALQPEDADRRHSGRL